MTTPKRSIDPLKVALAIEARTIERCVNRIMEFSDLTLDQKINITAEIRKLNGRSRMSTPTQAQIEAAAEAYRGAYMSAATHFEAMALALAAAAEVGEQKQWPKEFWDEFLRLRRQEEVNATIECCALWLEDNYPSARTIALEMRRALKELKDKP